MFLMLFPVLICYERSARISCCSQPEVDATTTTEQSTREAYTLYRVVKEANVTPQLQFKRILVQFGT